MQNQFDADQKSTDVIQKISHANKIFKDVIKSYFCQIVELLTKAWEVLNQEFSNTKKKLDVENLIFHLINLLNSWNANNAKNDLQSDQLDFLYKQDLIVLLAIKINSINTREYNQFVYIMQLDIKSQRLTFEPYNELKLPNEQK